MVLVLAGLAIRRLLDRGLAGLTLEQMAAQVGSTGAVATPTPQAPVVDSGGTGIDLLLAATPVLLALAACVLVLRLYPLPVAALAAALRRRRSLTPFLGAARSVRDPAGGAVPALAVVLGVSVAVLSSVLASTITTGAERAAWTANGADIRLSGARIDQAMLDRLAAVDGVESVGTITKVDTRPALTVAGERRDRSISVYLVDPAVPAVQADSPLIDAIPDEIFAAGAPPTVLTGGIDLLTASGAAELDKVGQVQIAQHLPQLAGMRTTKAYLVMSTAAWQAASAAEQPVPTLALIKVRDPEQIEEVAQRLRDQVPASLVQTPFAQLENYRSAPVTQGLTWAFLAAVAVTTLLTVLSIILVQLMGAPARGRLLAILRTMGLDHRQGRALTAWELAPLLALAFAVGALVGVVVPWMMLQALDLSGITGGEVQPALAFEPIVIGPALLGILLTVVVAVGLSAYLAGQADLARQLRIGDGQ